MVGQQLWLNCRHLLNYKVGGVNLPTWSGRLTVTRLSMVDWEAGGTVRSVKNLPGLLHTKCAG